MFFLRMHAQPAAHTATYIMFVHHHNKYVFVLAGQVLFDLILSNLLLIDVIKVEPSTLRI